MLSAAGVGSAADATSVVREHCFACHSGSEKQGNVDLAGLAGGTLEARYALWRKVLDQVETGAMPPEGEKRLSDAQRRTFRDGFQTLFVSGSPDPGPHPLRQLTRAEYTRTVRDLLGTDFDAAAAAGIAVEAVDKGFANRAASQLLDASLLEKYFTAADAALEHFWTHASVDAARRKLLAAAPLDKVAPPQAVRAVLRPFLKRAFRRPVTDTEVEKFAGMADAAVRSGDSFEAALRKAMKPILVAPDFLLRIEPTPPAGKVVRVGDHALATRLSYFVWGGPPEDLLMAAADAGELSKPEVLEAQTRRLLKDPRAAALSEGMLEAWLQLAHVKKALPNQNHFPTFTWSLREAMGEEARRFCGHIRAEDRSILEFLDADYTFVNAELARHYRLPPPPGNDFVKVSLRPEQHRGGLIGMGGVLAMTSHSDRTKPTARGKWILEVLLGMPPPPPANAGNFAKPDANRPEPKSFREKLAQHATEASCAACHARVDPLGFALENYDAIGNWREGTPETPVDNVGRLAGFGELKGVDGVRRVLQARRPQFVRNFVEKMMVYALGRDLNYFDEPALQKVVEELQKADHRFSAAVVGVVRSVPFQYSKAE